MRRNDVCKCFRVLYTRHLVKKHKTYHDGYVKVNSDHSAVLSDVDGNVLSHAKLKTEITADSEGILSFGGFLVNCDEECTVEDVTTRPPSTAIQISNEKAVKIAWNRPLPKFQGKIAAPRVGMKKKRASHEDTEWIKQESGTVPGEKRMRSDTEVLNLFRNPTAAVQTETQTKKCEKRASGSGAGLSNKQTNTRPSVKEKYDRARFDGDVLDLRFSLFGKKTGRLVNIPSAFSDADAYHQIWKAALHEEMQLRLNATCGKITTSLKSAENAVTQKEELNSKDSDPLSNLSTIFNRNGLEYHNAAGLTVYKKEKRVDDVFLLEIRNIHDTVRKDAKRYDLWIVSSDPAFLHKRSSLGRRVYDRLQVPWVAVFCSLWHGIAKDGKMQLQLVSRQRPWKSCEKVYAIRGQSISLEMTLWEALNHVNGVSGTLMKALIHNPQLPSFPEETSDTAENSPEFAHLQHSVPHWPESVASTLQQIVNRFRLNEDQRKVVESLVPWLKDEQETDVCPVRLIHGPFGTGKSSLLVAIIHLLASQQGDNDDDGVRILMCAHTNKAVDRIMEGLLESGFTDFIRVGLVSKIASSVLPYSVYYGSEANDNGNAAAELKRQLQSPTTPEEEKILRKELEDVEQGIILKRREKLSSARVVGVTCCSINSTLLQSQLFNIVVLDEACQIIEPLSFLPLIKTEAKYLITAGDPCQLPAVISHPTEPESGHGMSRSLFSRLQDLGHQPYMLKTQYRCHPDLSHVPNHYFYDGQLKDGCSGDDRPALIPGWPALCHIQTKGKAVKQENSSSYMNKPEAQSVVQVLQKLLRHGLIPEQIGVICFFKAQVSLIADMMQGKVQAVQVATVDSFQGMEKKVIILSMSVSEPGAFASDEQRLNVALTRAKNHLIIVGDAAVLSSLSPCMKALLQRSSTISLS